jgi:hypothetical protein
MSLNVLGCLQGQPRFSNTARPRQRQKTHSGMVQQLRHRNQLALAPDEWCKLSQKIAHRYLVLPVLQNIVSDIKILPFFSNFLKPKQKLCCVTRAQRPALMPLRGCRVYGNHRGREGDRLG